ncbi:PAS domain S-box protein [bacterium]|nr:PAS domain S-box protein [candidate division CSSED10-310 bacterium]
MAGASMGSNYLPFSIGNEDGKEDGTFNHIGNPADYRVCVHRTGEGFSPEDVQFPAGEKIVVERGIKLHDFVIQNGLEVLTATSNDPEDVLQKRVDGKHACALVSRRHERYRIKTIGRSNLKLDRKPLAVMAYCLATRNGQETLLSQPGGELKTNEKRDENRKMYSKWLGLGQKELDFFTMLSRNVTIPLLVVLIVAFAWSWMLRRQIRQKTRELKDGQDCFQYVFEAANVAKIITYLSGEILVNQAFADLLGYTAVELTGEKWFEFSPEVSVEDVQARMTDLLNGQSQSTRFEQQFIHKSGVLLWGDVNIVLLRDSNGNPLYYFTNIVDVTTRKQTEAILQRNEEFHRAMIECTPVALFTTDLSGIVLSWNHSAERIFGWRTAEVIGSHLPIADVNRSGEFEEVRKQVVQEGGFLEKELVRLKRDGSPISISLSVAPVRNDRKTVVGILWAAVDITERKVYENRLKWLLRRNELLSETASRLLRSVEPQKLVFELSQQIMIFMECQIFLNYLVNIDEETVYLNAYAGIQETEAREIGGITFGSSIGGRSAKERKPFLCEAIQDCNEPITAKMKSLGLQAYCCHPLMIQDQLIGTLAFGCCSRASFMPEEIDLMASVADLVAVAINRVETEKRLSHSEARFRMFAELAPLGIIIMDESENVLYVNPCFIEILGYEAKDIQCLHNLWFLIFPNEGDRNRISRQWYQAVYEFECTGAAIMPMESSVACKNGEYRFIECHTAKKEGLIAIVFADVSERKRAEAEQEKLQALLIQAQRLESIGRLAGGVAHDYNNMLSVIIGFTELARSKVQSEDSICGDLEEILSAAQRSTTITRQLLAFARRQTIRPERIDLNEIVESMLKMLRRLIGEDIDLLWLPGHGAMTVMMDPSQIDQIMANLCINARDAIRGVGKITIETSRVEIDDGYCVINPHFMPGEFVRLVVSDTGCGMDQETMNHVFEPFFTTKVAGEGTGLGLSTVLGIVKQNSGFISVYSEPENGAVFKIYLPVSTNGASVPLSKKQTEIPVGQGETIIVVEDEESILKLTGRILKEKGYSCISASTPEMAISILEDHSGRVDLLITDVVMPEMNGRELAENLKKRFPELKVLYMSGYTANVIAHRGILDEGINFIQKPFSNRDLLIKVREVLAM